ncbi:MAG: aminoglycoside phosphotransferase family protein [Bacteroidota bacterium]
MSFIARQFRVEGGIGKMQPFGNGHINSTYKVLNSEQGKPNYLLQKINRKVFPAVGEMMVNINLVTKHLSNKFSKDSPQVYQTLQIIPTKEDDLFYHSRHEGFWRMYRFFDDLVGYDQLTKENHIYEGAKAFGVFLNALNDFDQRKMYIPIPDFHNVIYRMDALNEAIDLDGFDRLKSAKDLVAFARNNVDSMTQISKAGNAGQIPLRITHNDTKFNNVLLDASGKARCVIDLDTVMPGFVHFDFGDGVRTSITNALEDEADLANINIEMARFKSFSEGYLEGSGDILTKEEKRFLALSCPMLAFLMGIRFLTDYLKGDKYYKTHFEDQNFFRARAQLDLCGKMMERLDEMNKIIARIDGH